MAEIYALGRNKKAIVPRTVTPRARNASAQVLIKGVFRAGAQFTPRQWHNNSDSSASH